VEKVKRTWSYLGPTRDHLPKNTKKTPKREEKSGVEPPPTFPKLMSKNLGFKILSIIYK
jgi:hypothetical protein